MWVCQKALSFGNRIDDQMLTGVESSRRPTHRIIMRSSAELTKLAEDILNHRVLHDQLIHREFLTTPSGGCTNTIRFNCVVLKTL